MKRKLQLLLLAFLTIVGIGWAITTETTWTLTVDPSINEDTENQFKTLKAAVIAANANKQTNPIVISVKNGTYDIARDEVTSDIGNYLAITRDNVSIVGESEDNVKIGSTTSSVNGNWADQNLITIHGNNVTIKNATIVCKNEVNKVIEVLGDNVTLDNLTCNTPEEKKFAGSIYFNSPADDTEKNIGTVHLTNLELNNGRITFTGAEKGSVVMNNLVINYDKVAIDGESMSDLQQYSPFGHVADRPNLSITGGETVTVNLNSDANSYKLDAATVDNMPTKSTLTLGDGEYTATLTVNKSLNIIGTGKETTTLKGWININAYNEVKPEEITIKGLFIEKQDKGANGATIPETGLPNPEFTGNPYGVISVSSNAKVTITDCKLTHKANKSGTNGIPDTNLGFWASGVRMEGKGAEVILKNPEIDILYYGIAVRNENQKLTIDGGTIMGWGAIMTSAGNLSVADGTIANTNTSITANKTKFISNVLAQGNGNAYGALILQQKFNGVTAHFEECTVEVGPTRDEALKAKQTTVIGIRSYGNKVSFERCTLNNEAAENASQAALIRLGWDDGTDKSELKTNQITISNSQIKIKEGEKAVYSNRSYFTKAIDQLTINGTIYDEKSGLISYANGTLQSVITSAKEGDIIELPAGEHDCTDPLIIDKKITLTSLDTVNANRALIKGHIVIEAENVTIKDLKFECNSTGYKYNEKNAISVFANAVTLTGNEFTEAAGIGDAFVTNGIVLYPQTPTQKSAEGITAAYQVTGNTFTGIKKATADGTTSTPIIIRENFSDKSQLGDDKPTTATIKDFASDNEIATKNTFKDCVGGEYYVRLSGADYLYSYVYGADATVAAVKATVENGSLQTAITSTELLNGLKAHTSALKANLHIQCSDVLVVTDEATAKALAKQGKAVKHLKFDDGGTDGKYTFAEIDTSDPHIISLQDSVVFGVDPIKLITNVSEATIAIKEGTNTENVVSLDAGGTLLTVLKPGTVTLEISVTEGADETKKYEQTLKVLKRRITLTGGLKAYGDTYDGEDSVNVHIIADSIKFSGLKGGSTLNIAQTKKSTETETIVGKMADANVGTNKVVTFTDDAIALSPDSTAWYDLAPVTFVTTNISKKELTVTAIAKAKKAALTRSYGTDNPEFDVTYGTTENGETAASVVEGTVKFNCAATKTSPAGDYLVTPYGLTSNNYALKFVACTLKVEATTPTIETVSAVVNKDKTITMIGKIVDNGGAINLATADTIVKFSVKKDDGEATEYTEATRKGDNFTYTLETNATAGIYTILAKATIGKEGSTKEGSGKEISVVIDEKKAQTVSFASSLSKLMYGSSATLAGTSDEAAATGAYTYSIVDDAGNSVLAVNETTGELTTKGIGKATVKVSRATDTDYAAAEAYMTIEVTPKPVSVTLSNLDKLTKEYDGTTALTTQPVYTLSTDAKANSTDVVSVAAVAGAQFAGKNAGSQTILLPEVKLTGAQAANYTLLQPSAPVGSITKKALTVKVNSAVRNYNDLHTDYTFTWDGFIDGESDKTPGIYSGTLVVTEPTTFTNDVTEKTGQLSLNIASVKLVNYALTAPADQQGMLTIKRGTPIAIVYGSGNIENFNTLLVDDAGYEDLTFGDIAAGQFTQIKTKDGAVVGQTLNKINAAAVNSLIYSMSTKATSSWDNTEAIPYAYGSTIEITTEAGYIYESSNTERLTITNNENNTLTCKVNGIGGAVIIATNTTSAADIKFMYFDLQPQTVTVVPTAEYSKAYDGTTLASGLQVKLMDNDDKEVTGDIALNIAGINFNFGSKDVSSSAQPISPSQTLTLTGSQRNNYKLATDLVGKIDPATLTITSPISKYYDGKTTTVVSDYAATGRVEGETVPVKVTFADANVDPEAVISSWTLVDNANYSLADPSSAKGSILKSTMQADLKQAPSTSEVIKRARFTLIETGEKEIQLTDYKPEIQLINGEFHVSGGDTQNYTVTYASTKADNANDPTPPTTSTAVESISLDKSELTLPRLETYTLKATINPDNATNKTVSWTSSDDKIAKVDANGKVTALAVGKATITVTTDDGGKTATCEVTVDFATGLEEAIANTAVYGKNGNIHILPVAPVQVAVINLTGVIVYQATINSTTQIPVNTGIYLVKVGTGNSAVVTKVGVR